MIDRLGLGLGIYSDRRLIAPAPPVVVETFRILTQNGDALVTQAGDNLVWKIQ